MQNLVNECYESLLDQALYVIDDWLRLELSPQAEDKLRTIHAATGYLFGRFLLEETPGAEYTAFLKQEMGASFSPKAMSEKAVNMKLRMDTPDFLKLGTSFTKYLEFLAPAEPNVLTALKDAYGRLAFAYIEEVVEAIVDENKEWNYLKIVEPLFLGLTDAFFNLYKQKWGKDAMAFGSSPYFIDVQAAHEKIRSEILD